MALIAKIWIGFALMSVIVSVFIPLVTELLAIPSSVIVNEPSCALIVMVVPLQVTLLGAFMIGKRAAVGVNVGVKGPQDSENWLTLIGSSVIGPPSGSEYTKLMTTLDAVQAHDNVSQVVPQT